MNAKKLGLLALLVTISSTSFAAENHFLRYNKATNMLEEANAPVAASTSAPAAYSSKPQQSVPARQTREVPTAAPITSNYAAPLANKPSYQSASSYQPKQGFYVSAKGALEYATINGIGDASNGQYVLDFPTGQTPVVNTSVNQIAGGVKIGMGYNIPVSATINLRPEVEYGLNFLTGYHSNNVYNALTVPNVFNQQVLDSDIFSQTALLKLYTDFSIQNSPFLPYIMVGLGWVQNQVTSNSQFEAASNPGAVIANKQTATTNNFAWSAGLGVRYAATNNLMIDLGYEFLSLGKLTWTFPTGVPAVGTADFITGGLQSSNYYVNSILLGLTWNFYQ